MISLINLGQIRSSSSTANYNSNKNDLSRSPVKLQQLNGSPVRDSLDNFKNEMIGINEYKYDKYYQNNQQRAVIVKLSEINNIL